jgi:uncharacterized membrane protein YdjX (TVP38/TMEM64 family)
MSFHITKKNIAWSLGILLVAILFVETSLLSAKYQSALTHFMGQDEITSKIIYVFVTVLAIIIAPFSTLPLLPLASSMWGWFTAGLLTVCGWVIGSQCAFIIARTFGKPLVKKLISLDGLESLEDRFPARKLFITVTLMRMVLPVDILSYALGLFSKIDHKRFFFSTLIGVSPFAFIFAYTGTLSFRLQALVFLGIGIFFLILYLVRRKNERAKRDTVKTPDA